MSVFYIDGGQRLSGSLSVHGAKNSVLPILAATILNAGESIIRNCPALSDVDASLRILRHLGCVAKREGDAVIVDSSSITRTDIPDCLMREMRSSVVFLGAIVARCGQAVMSFPGGCELGPRPIDLHLAALRELGTDIYEECGNLICQTAHLTGREINLSFPSVGATENVMLAACSAHGTTRITNAACEPEIEDLQNFLLSCGAHISGAGTPTITINGRAPLHAAEHRIIADRIVASTYLSAVAMAGGDALIRDVEPTHLSTVIRILQEAGCVIRPEAHALRIIRAQPLKAVRPIRTMPYPGFPTDSQSPIMAVVTKAQGTTLFVETIFENRFRHAGELIRMGADIRIEGRVAVVSGVSRLCGACVSATDLRGGAALVIAALGAQGQTTITHLHHIDRGYERLEHALSALGARIQRVSETNQPL